MTEPRSPSVLVVDDDEAILLLVEAALRSVGYEVVTAHNGAEALEHVADVVPDLVISDVLMPDGDGLTFVRRLRELPRGDSVPFIFLSARATTDDVVAGMQLGADDYLRKPFDVAELVARARAKIDRPTIPRHLAATDPRSGFLAPRAFFQELEREALRAARTGRDGMVGAVSIVELATLRRRLGSRAVDELQRHVVAAIAAGGDPLESIGAVEDEFLLLLPETSAPEAEERLRAVGSSIATQSFAAGHESVRLTAALGYTTIAAEPSVAVDRARVAARASGLHLDLEPRSWDESMERDQPRQHGRIRRVAERLRVPLQILATQLLLVLPFFLYVALDAAGVDVAPIVYLVVVAALLMTAALIWVEGFASLRATEAPTAPGTPYPRASAIIAAYLPNEAATIIETVESFLAVDYPAELQIVLAYNTPRDLPIEDELREIARRHPQFVPYRVENSTSKAQNVNAAIAIVTGEFVGVFDADHHPMRDAFTRAWHWLSNGYDVVQGHCLVRNGDASWVARTVAVEFEMIYAVSHPGRARLHDFGIFGGSNGFWRTQLLAETRMRGWMLTEDIDSSLRVVANGGKIASDRRLVSRELAPTTLRALWNQRMRWAQGWFQVSKRHAWHSLRSSDLSRRNKLGLLYLLVWREAYPWISLQMFPVVGFYAYKAHGAQNLNWLVPIFVLTSLFTLSVGPWQTLFAWRLAAPEIKERKWWFLSYLLISSIFYTELKNVISRVAQIKELMRERTWKVTPRATPSGSHT